MAEAGGFGEFRLQVGVYRRLLGAHLRSDWHYRTSFLFLLVAQALVAGLDLAVIAVIFGQVDALAGWSVVEVAVDTVRSFLITLTGSGGSRSC